jgi:hypothetical protein
MVRVSFLVDSIALPLTLTLSPADGGRGDQEWCVRYRLILRPHLLPCDSSPVMPNA